MIKIKKKRKEILYSVNLLAIRSSMIDKDRSRIIVIISLFDRSRIETISGCKDAFGNSTFLE